MNEKRYFNSRYNRGMSKQIETFSFFDVKRAAYRGALEGLQKGFTETWADRYVNAYPPSTTLWLYEDTIREYADYLTGVKTKTETVEAIKLLQEKWEVLFDHADGFAQFMNAMDAAFKSQNKKFGEVQFTCPKCGAECHAVRLNTPKNIAHKITIRAKCKGCGVSMMN